MGLGDNLFLSMFFLITFFISKNVYAYCINYTLYNAFIYIMHFISTTSLFLI